MKSEAEEKVLWAQQSGSIALALKERGMSGVSQWVHVNVRSGAVLRRCPLGSILGGYVH